MSMIPESDLKQNGNSLTMQFKSPSQSTLKCPEISQNVILCGLIKFQIRNHVNNLESYNSTYKKSQTISIRLSKLFNTDRLIYSVKLSSTKLGIASEKELFVVDDKIDNAYWQIFYESNNIDKVVWEFDLSLSLDISISIFRGFTSLHKDTELTDFELRGTDGQVAVHKLVLAACSPVLKTMLAGEWKETASGFVELKASEKTLKELKDYMYLHKLPESNIKQLAEIASLYMMADLEECCTVKLLTSITAETAADLLDFAVQFKMATLKLGILELVHGGMIKIEDMIRKSDASRASQPQPRPSSGRRRHN